ncbi:MAG: flagellin N-terminal helical domain-containing protein [Planctomycetota bacterium]|jgi:flagellin
MSRINTNIPSLIAQSSLSRANDDLATRLQRLSTGLRINRGADDPAGLIVSERLRSELQGLERAIGNSERASSVIATTEAYLTEVSDLLTSVKGLIIEAANTNTASFAGLQLLNGSLAYLTSGIATSALAGVDVYGAQFGTNTSIPVQVEVISSAQTAQLFLSGTAAGALTSSVSIEIAGTLGVQVLTFVSGTSMQEVVDAVNTVSESTGVSAALVSAADQTSGLTFNSLTYGSDAFVSVQKTGAGGDFFRVFGDANVETQRDTGRDVTAIVNGTLATGDGLDVSLNTPSLRLELNLTAAYAQTTGSVKAFDITGGGVTFQLGPEISSTQQVGIGFKSIAASRIGGTLVGGIRYFLDSITSGGDNSLIGGRAREAAQVLEASITEVSVLRGRIGAFERNTVQTNIRSLQVGFENIAASESKIRDTDFARETAALTRAQILTQAGTSVLTTANLTSQNVLALLQ